MRPRNFNLTHRDPSLFTKAQWKWPGIIYVIYRIIMALYFVVWIILSGVWQYPWTNSQENRIKWLIYLTNWSFLFLTLNTMLQAGVATIAYIRQIQDGHHMMGNMPWYLKIQWVFYNVSTLMAIKVTVSFWKSIYHPEYYVHPVDWVAHLSNAIYVLIDLCITAIPVRIYHFVHGMIFHVTYLVFSAVYVIAGGTNALDKPYIYPGQDWTSDPWNDALHGLLPILIGAPIIWVMVFGIYRLRLAVYYWVYHDDLCQMDTSQDSNEYLPLPKNEQSANYGSIT
jgi:hypothetical protein